MREEEVFFWNLESPECDLGQDELAQALEDQLLLRCRTVQAS